MAKAAAPILFPTPVTEGAGPGACRRRYDLLAKGPAAGAAVVALLLVGAGCASTVTTTAATTGVPPERVTAIVAFPPLLGFGGPAERLRAARRLGDGLIDETGGRVILAEELAGRSPKMMAEGVRALGEDPATTVTFSLSALRTERLESIGLAGAGAAQAVRRYADYKVRLEVRRVEAAEVVGRVETFASALANAPEVDASGRPQGLQKALDIAVRDGLTRFAPHLKPGPAFPTVAEIPPELEQPARSGAPALVERLRRLVALYPELTPDDLAKLATGRARFLIIKPGRLGALGVEAGDLLAGVGGQALGSRAALARSLARGEIPAFSVERSDGRFLVGRPAKVPARPPVLVPAAHK